MVHNRSFKDCFDFFLLNKHQNANHGFLIHLHGYAIESKNKEYGIILRYDIIGLYCFEKKMDVLKLNVALTAMTFSKSTNCCMIFYASFTSIKQHLCCITMFLLLSNEKKLGCFS